LKIGIDVPSFQCKDDSMIARSAYFEQLAKAVGRSPVTALLGPRQCGKTTLAHRFAEGRTALYFDLESQPDRQRLQNPELMLGALEGIAILDV
jgi:predicted AAA+ superfamily ATPase